MENDATKHSSSDLVLVPGNTRHPDLSIRPGACLRASAASSIPSSDLVLVSGDHPLETTSSDQVLVLRDPRLPHLSIRPSACHVNPETLIKPCEIVAFRVLPHSRVPRHPFVVVIQISLVIIRRLVWLLFQDIFVRPSVRLRRSQSPRLNHQT